MAVTAVLRTSLLLMLCCVWAVSPTPASTTPASMTTVLVTSEGPRSTETNVTATFTETTLAESNTSLPHTATPSDNQTASDNLTTLLSQETRFTTWSSTYSQREVPTTDPSIPFAATTAVATCPESDQIHCGTSDRCTRIRYICDGDNDCGDNSDEASSLCAVWRNNDCERNSARCTRNGRSDCVTISHYCTLDNPPCEGYVDPRLCVMLGNGKIQSLHTIRIPTTTPEPTIPPTTEPSIHVRNENWSDEFLLKLNNTIRHPDCPWLYTKVGKQCLSIFFIGSMSWMEARTFCQTIGGDLMSLTDDLNVFSTVLQHLSIHQLTADFWIGGIFVNETLGWTWTDNTPMPLGSPYWAVRHLDSCASRTITYTILNTTTLANDGECYYYKQTPATPPAGHCAALTYEFYHYITDEDCFSKKSPLCVLPAEHPKQAL